MTRSRSVWKPWLGGLVGKRHELGLSEREAARSLGIDPGTWAGWELGVNRPVFCRHSRAVS